MRSPATSSSLFHAVKTVRLGWQRSGLRSRRHRLLIQAAGSRLVSTDSSGPLEPSENVESTAESAPVASEPLTLPPPPPPLPVEKPERGRRLKTTPVETIDWPAELDVLWAPSEDLDADAPDTATLPPPQILDEALNNLLITLHPQTQNRAVYASPDGPAVEPTLALYCPIEGGDYVIDATVKEMARRIGAEVLVIDSVQLAAGEWGSFGPAANMLRLPRNPLHFRATSTTSTPASSSAEEDDDDDYGDNSVPTAQMLLTVMSPSSPRGTVMSASKLSNPQPSKAKQFFDALVNMPSLDGVKSPPVPRIIYIRDFPTLAPTSATWYRPLLNAVRQRRRGPIASPSSPVTNPITIIFGLSPAITPPEVISSPSSSNAGRGLLSVMMNRGAGASPAASASKPSKTDWNEDEDATKARESRLRRRLKKWERGDPSLLDELPTLTNQDEGEEGDPKRDNVVMLGGAAIPLPFFPVSQGSPSNRSPSEGDSKTGFFRTSILVPSVRSTADERDARIERRQEINELTARMAIGAVGGVLERTPAASLIPKESTLEFDENESDTETDTTPSSSDAAAPEVSVSAHEQMWEEWGKRVELWMTVKHIADRALGSVVANSVSYAQKQSLEPTLVPWDAVSNAWTIQRSASELRKTWFKEAVKAAQAEKAESDTAAENSLPTLDEVVERIKNDPDIDSHEQRLLPCIVDPATMPTGFSQVHLPTKTIDSVRTIVSLPLLHPQAFQQGILKEHSITGCLLFGPPGTGKTLVVRALAKEAGCRMMNVSPSDVMDMYVGEGEKLVKAVFALARKLSPCVVFLDEIDALLGARSSGRDSGSSAAYRGVITEFMQEMDGLKTMADSNVIVIGATNRPFDLDDAVLRRLPRRLLVDLPGEKEREAILKIMLRNEELASDVDIQDLAKRTESFSGSDLKHLCVSAAVDAVKETVELPWLVSEKEVPISTPAEQPMASEQPLDEKETPEESTQSDSEPSTTTEPLKNETPPQSETSSNAPEDKPVPNVTRTLYQRHFSKAMKEITPSSSEATGTLAALRKWNEEFGEGHRDRKRKQIWGKGRFGFTDPANFSEEDGRVLPSTASAGDSTSTTTSRP
ncbi:AAA-domain-containing protein [Hymenopellis radicata]|nr:AAA-domain-containing protein [Hymenopellis radicata]